MEDVDVRANSGLKKETNVRVSMKNPASVENVGGDTDGESFGVVRRKTEPCC